VRTCPNCGEENPARFRLCGFCGTPFAVAPAPKEVRKTVSIVFCDLQGSTSLAEALDSESMREVMSRYFDEMQAALETHGGTVEKFIGDAVMAVFGLPRVHEDDAVRAVRAAHAMQTALTALNDELGERYGVRLVNRTGVNTGEVVAGDATTGQRLVTGDTVNVAARLEQAAPASGILLGELTWRLVKDAVDAEPVEPLELKGKSERVPAYRLLGLRRTTRAGREEDRPLVGRERELRGLLDSLAEVRVSGRCRVATLLGQAGVGKSRLLDEVSRIVEHDAQVLRGRCLSYGRGITFWPLVEAVQEAAGIEDGDSPARARERLAARLGAGGEAAVERVAAAIGLSDAKLPVDELFWGVRKLLEAVAAERPLVLVFEDVHWAELTFLDFIEHLGSSADAPVLVLCGARPELREIRPDWPGHVVELEPLAAADSERIIANVLGGTGLAHSARRRIVEAAEGNPLFVEQLLSMLIDEHLLEFDGSAWRPAAALDEPRIPPTINALLSARLDQLEAGERAVVEPAAVVGLIFYAPAVRALVPEPLRPEVVGHLGTLARKRLVATGPPDPIAEHTHRFEHALVREAAYRGLLKRERATLHERFVEWLAGAERPEELDEIIAYHLEQAHRYLSQLGPLDAHGRELGTRAADLLVSAGGKAFDREDMPAAANLLRRAVQLLPPLQPRRLELLPPLGEALLDIGEFAVAEGYLEEGIALAREAGHEGLAARAQLVRLLVVGQAGGRKSWADEIARDAEATLPALEAARDDVGIATAWRVVAWAQGTVCRYGAAAAAAERAMEHAARAGDERQRRRAAVQYAVAATYGPMSVAEALPGCERILAQSHGDRRSEGIVMSLLARLEAMRGDVERARGLYRRARVTLEDMGRGPVASSTSLDSCGVETLAGDLPAAERELRRDYAALSEMGEKYLLSTVAAELARVLCAQGRDEEAWHESEIAEDLAAEDDLASQALWRSVRGRLLGRRGEAESGIAMARSAVDMLAGTDSGVSQADALLDLAEVLALARDPGQALEHAREAEAILRAKGDRLGTAIARERREALAGQVAADGLSASGRCAS
jgi:class 3 adenylate cyclase/tetratricopeptide (TPR) repeat protein